MSKFVDFPNASGTSHLNIDEIVRFFDVGVRKFGNENKSTCIVVMRGYPEDYTLFVPVPASILITEIENARRAL